EKCTWLHNSLNIENISKLPAIQASRKAYKAMGKDPARYRLSAEALLRRAVKEKSLYRINNVVDLLNLVSITSGYSIGGYDVEKITGGVSLGTGCKDEPYVGLGRGILNIEGMPVLRDAEGAFGSPTSDSERTGVTFETQRFLMVIFGFYVGDSLAETEKFAVDLLKHFADAHDFEIKTV
ncbi:MAG: phenylalanine--tRNA ligase beta subunit-related protein, partial [Prolixibacteraceae bacterium]|nr:phenylalanine--tRNA ligase beta subunit-related protein [Prolixibacteraceae bacterium]